MKYNHYIINVVFLMALLICYQPNGAMAEPLDYPRNISDIKKIKFNQISNDSIRDRFLQLSNCVNYANGYESKWYISPEFRLGAEKYYILFQEFYNDSHFYLCKKPSGNGYPPIICICDHGLAGETLLHFEIDEQSDILTLSYYSFDPIRYRIGIPLNEDKNLFNIITRKYKISNDFEQIEESTDSELLVPSQAIIPIWL